MIHINKIFVILKGIREDVYPGVSVYDPDPYKGVHKRNFFKDEPKTKITPKTVGFFNSEQMMHLM